MTELPQTPEPTSANAEQPQYAPPVQQWQQPVPPAGYPEQPGYAPQPGYHMTQALPPMNVFAIIGFVAVFFSGLVGVILGHIALSQIKRTGERGRGLALSATIIGYVRLAGEILGAFLLLAMFGVFGYAAASGSTMS
ncbi:hypothetical protein ACI1US_01232 [Leucobacter sp. BZR 635]